jgi:hypothetical protein
MIQSGRNPLLARLTRYGNSDYSIARNDETQYVVRKWYAVHMVGELNRTARKLRSDLGEGDNRAVAVRSGDPDCEANLLAGLYGLDCAGGAEYVPQQGSGPFAVLLAMIGREGDVLGD